MPQTHARKRKRDADDENGDEICKGFRDSLESLLKGAKVLIDEVQKIANTKTEIKNGVNQRRHRRSTYLVHYKLQY